MKKNLKDNFDNNVKKHNLDRLFISYFKDYDKLIELLAQKLFDIMHTKL